MSRNGLKNSFVQGHFLSLQNCRLSVSDEDTGSFLHKNGAGKRIWFVKKELYEFKEGGKKMMNTNILLNRDKLIIRGVMIF